MGAEPNVLARMRKDAETIFTAGLSAVEPGKSVEKYCRLDGNRFIVGDRVYDLSSFRNLLVVGAGKAAAPMAKALERILGDRIQSGLITVKYGYTAPLDRVSIVEAGHPVPDAGGLSGAKAILNLVQQAGNNDLILCVISGGGSALLPLPAPGLSLQDKQETIRLLLSCGADIHEINTIRKHTSAIKGGRLTGAAHPATVVTLILSDVVGDDLDVIASGPTVPDSSTFGDCRAICRRYGIENRLPESVMKHFQAGGSGRVPETPKPDHPAFNRTQNLIVGSNIEAVLAARQTAENLGYHTLVLSSMIEGETRHVARVHSAVAREIIRTGNPIPKPACVLSGGETTVNVTGSGLGGRNQEFALATAAGIAGERWIVVLSGGTDGTDGPTDAAGAIADTVTLERARHMGLAPMDFLADNDAYHFFDRLGDLLMTGPTNTNVMDLRVVLVT